MLKNKILKIAAIVFVVILLVIIITLVQIYFQERSVLTPSTSYPASTQVTPLEDPNIKQIKVEILDEAAREEAGFGSRLADPADIQVISRDENGKIKSYRKIYSPADVINSLYDPTGERTAGMGVE